ncbi:MAG: F-type H+-transporting ATPase subunit delta [Hyphomicrobiaceae bacterium]|jgi:F-type H+-transporting ATPase subunit delta
MSSKTVAKRYAKALYELASEEGSLDSVWSGLEVIAAGVAELDDTMLAPGLLTPVQRKDLAAKLGHSVGAEETLAHALGVIGEADRLGELVAVASAFRDFSDANSGRVRIVITTASELSGEELDAIVGKFREKADREVIADVVVDDSLIGGIQVEIEGRVYDGSVRTQLARLESRMAGRA